MGGAVGVLGSFLAHTCPSPPQELKRSGGLHWSSPLSSVWLQLSSSCMHAPLSSALSQSQRPTPPSFSVHELW